LEGSADHDFDSASEARLTMMNFLQIRALSL
jgi:hypothetical protein